MLPGTWAFKIKRFLDGLVRKLKSRWCCHGDRQVKDVDFFDTCAPVVKWTAVRSLLILTAQLALTTKQVDHTAAFVHADIDKPPDCSQMTPDELVRDAFQCLRGQSMGWQERAKPVDFNAGTSKARVE